MYTPHPTVFKQPLDEGVSVWRYMDLSKFIWMIQRDALFFCRSDSLGDPFEGHYTKVIADQEEEHIKTLQANNQFAAIPAAVHAVEMAREVFRVNTLELPKQLKQKYFVSCWHMNEEESPAMWKLYTSQNESICIRSKYKTLANLLPEESLLGCVGYINYHRDSFDTTEMWSYIIHKRKSFEHGTRDTCRYLSRRGVPFRISRWKGPRSTHQCGRTDRRNFRESYRSISALRSCNGSCGKIRLERACPRISGERGTGLVIRRAKKCKRCGLDF
jgi:hypothetical protein